MIFTLAVSFVNFFPKEIITHRYVSKYLCNILFVAMINQIHSNGL